MSGGRRRRWIGVWALGLAVLAGLSGCKTVHEELAPIRETTLTVARSGGEVTLSWIGVEGMYYSVMYADARGAKARWQILPGAANVRGLATGEPIVVMDRVKTAQPRYYRLVQDGQPVPTPP